MFGKRVLKLIAEPISMSIINIGKYDKFWQRFSISYRMNYTKHKVMT
jgi:hypothetical protein